MILYILGFKALRLIEIRKSDTETRVRVSTLSMWLRISFSNRLKLFSPLSTK